MSERPKSMLTFRKSNDQLNSFGSSSNVAGSVRGVSTIGPSSMRTELANQDKIPRSGSTKIDDFDIKKALTGPLKADSELDDWDKMIQTFSVISSPTVKAPPAPPPPEVRAHKQMLSNASTTSFSSVDEDLIDQISGSLGNLNKSKASGSSSNPNLQGISSNEGGKDQVFSFLRQSGELAQLREELMQERRKRQTQEVLLMKLYQEFQKLKISVHMSKKLQTMEELEEDIAALEAKKEKMDASTKLIMTSPQEGSIVDITMQKLEKFKDDPSKKADLLSIAINFQNSIKSSRSAIENLKIDIEHLSAVRDRRYEMLAKQQLELETVKNQLRDVKLEKIDELGGAIAKVVDVTALPKPTAVEVIKIKSLPASDSLNLMPGSNKMGDAAKWMKKVSDTMSISRSETVSGGIGDGRERPYHKFLPKTYRTPTKCDFCNESLWGKELKCEVCRFHCHAKCSQGCGTCGGSRSSDGASGVFGVPLAKSSLDPAKNVPIAVLKCIEAVESRGMEMEGVYRKSGPVSQVNALMTAFNAGQYNLNEEGHVVEIPAITSTLKQFFRDLPEPLIPSKYYDQLIELISIENLILETPNSPEKLENFSQIIKSFPPENIATLQCLIHHLHKLTLKSEKNLMVVQNLSVVFGPTLMRPIVYSAQSDLNDSATKNAVVEYMITNVGTIF